MASPAQAPKRRFLALATAGGRTLSCTLLFLAIGFGSVHAEQSGPFAGLTVDSSLERYGAAAHVSGGFKIHGSDTMHALMRRLVLRSQRAHQSTLRSTRSGKSSKACSPLAPSGWWRQE